MSEILTSIEQLAPKALTYSELEEYSNSQYLTINTLQLKITQLTDEISHLKKVLSTAKLVDEAVVIHPEPSTVICEMEINRLKEISFQRGLTLEETKRLDLLVKNLLLSKEQKKDVSTSFRNLSGLSKDSLMQIASQPEPTEDF